MTLYDKKYENANKDQEYKEIQKIVRNSPVLLPKQVAEKNLQQIIDYIQKNKEKSNDIGGQKFLEPLKPVEYPILSSVSQNQGQILQIQNQINDNALESINEKISDITTRFNQQILHLTNIQTLKKPEENIVGQGQISDVQQTNKYVDEKIASLINAGAFQFQNNQIQEDIQQLTTRLENISSKFVDRQDYLRQQQSTLLQLESIKTGIDSKSDISEIQGALQMIDAVSKQSLEYERKFGVQNEKLAKEINQQIKPLQEFKEKIILDKVSETENIMEKIGEIEKKLTNYDNKTVIQEKIDQLKNTQLLNLNNEQKTQIQNQIIHSIDQNMTNEITNKIKQKTNEFEQQINQSVNFERVNASLLQTETMQKRIQDNLKQIKGVKEDINQFKEDNLTTIGEIINSRKDNAIKQIETSTQLKLMSAVQDEFYYKEGKNNVMKAIQDISTQQSQISKEYEQTQQFQQQSLLNLSKQYYKQIKSQVFDQIIDAPDDTQKSRIIQHISRSENNKLNDDVKQLFQLEYSDNKFLETVSTSEQQSKFLQRLQGVDYYLKSYFQQMQIEPKDVDFATLKKPFIDGNVKLQFSNILNYDAYKKIDEVETQYKQSQQIMETQIQQLHGLNQSMDTKYKEQQIHARNQQTLQETQKTEMQQIQDKQKALSQLIDSAAIATQINEAILKNPEISSQSLKIQSNATKLQNMLQDQVKVVEEQNKQQLLIAKEKTENTQKLIDIKNEFVLKIDKQIESQEMKTKITELVKEKVKFVSEETSEIKNKIKDMNTNINKQLEQVSAQDKLATEQTRKLLENNIQAVKDDIALTETKAIGVYNKLSKIDHENMGPIIEGEIKRQITNNNQIVEQEFQSVKDVVDKEFNLHKQKINEFYNQAANSMQQQAQLINEVGDQAAIQFNEVAQNMQNIEYQNEAEIQRIQNTVYEASKQNQLMQEENTELILSQKLELDHMQAIANKQEQNILAIQPKLQKITKKIETQGSAFTRNLSNIRQEAIQAGGDIKTQVLQITDEKINEIGSQLTQVKTITSKQGEDLTKFNTKILTINEDLAKVNVDLQKKDKIMLELRKIGDNAAQISQQNTQQLDKLAETQNDMATTINVQMLKIKDACDLNTGMISMQKSETIAKLAQEQPGQQTKQLLNSVDDATKIQFDQFTSGIKSLQKIKDVKTDKTQIDVKQKTKEQTQVLIEDTCQTLAQHLLERANLKDAKDKYIDDKFIVNDAMQYKKYSLEEIQIKDNTGKYHKIENDVYDVSQVAVDGVVQEKVIESVHNNAVAIFNIAHYDQMINDLAFQGPTAQTWDDRIGFFNELQTMSAQEFFFKRDPIQRFQHFQEGVAFFLLIKALVLATQLQSVQGLQFQDPYGRLKYQQIYKNMRRFTFQQTANSQRLQEMGEAIFTGRYIYWSIGIWSVLTDVFKQTASRIFFSEFLKMMAAVMANIDPNHAKNMNAVLLILVKQFIFSNDIKNAINFWWSLLEPNLTRQPPFDINQRTKHEYMKFKINPAIYTIWTDYIGKNLINFDEIVKQTHDDMWYELYKVSESMASWIFMQIGLFMVEMQKIFLLSEEIAQDQLAISHGWEVEQKIQQFNAKYHAADFTNFIKRINNSTKMSNQDIIKIFATKVDAKYINKETHKVLRRTIEERRNKQFDMPGQLRPDYPRDSWGNPKISFPSQLEEAEDQQLLALLDEKQIQAGVEEEQKMDVT